MTNALNPTKMISGWSHQRSWRSVRASIAARAPPELGAPVLGVVVGVDMADILP